MRNIQVGKEIETRCRENSLRRHGGRKIAEVLRWLPRLRSGFRLRAQRPQDGSTSTPARSPGSFAVGQDDNMSRNMARYPIVLKDYGIVAYFARGFRYNKQALVYSGLLACNAGLASENAAFTAAYGLKDRPQ